MLVSTALWIQCQWAFETTKYTLALTDGYECHWTFGKKKWISFEKKDLPPEIIILRIKSRTISENKDFVTSDTHYLILRTFYESQKLAMQYICCGGLPCWCLCFVLYTFILVSQRVGDMLFFSIAAVRLYIKVNWVCFSNSKFS